MVKCSETTHLSDSRGIWFACGSLVTQDPKSRPRQHRWRRAQSPEESRPTWYCYLQICCLRSWLWGDRLKGMDDQKTLILRVQGKVSNINTAANVMCSERHQKESQWWGLLAENGTPGAWAAHLAWFPTPGCPSTRPRCPSSIPANSCFLLCCHSNKSSYLKNCAIKKSVLDIAVYSVYHITITLYSGDLFSLVITPWSYFAGDHDHEHNSGQSQIRYITTHDETKRCMTLCL